MLRITQDSIFNKKNDIVLPEEIVLYLNDEVSLENVTFERFFSLIMLNHTFFDIVFYRALGGFKIADFEKDFTAEPLPGVRDFFADVHHLQVAWATDLYPDPSGDDIPNISMFIDFSGKSIIDTEIGYSLTFASLSEYKHLPLVINPNFIIYKKNDPILTVKRNMTLYDVIKAILFEITFYGNPLSRDVFKDEFVKITNDLDLEESVHTLSFDDLFQNIKDNLEPDIKPVDPNTKPV